MFIHAKKVDKNQWKKQLQITRNSPSHKKNMKYQRRNKKQHQTEKTSNSAEHRERKIFVATSKEKLCIFKKQTRNNDKPTISKKNQQKLNLTLKATISNKKQQKSNKKQQKQFSCYFHHRYITEFILMLWSSYIDISQVDYVYPPY